MCCPSPRDIYQWTDEQTGEELCSDGEYWMPTKNTCQHCFEELQAQGKPFRWAEEQYSFGVYAGRYCDACWQYSGYRDVHEHIPFDPADAGEALEPEDY